jgi:hypothetical protein
LGLVNVAAVITTAPNNDDEPGTDAANNVVSPLKRFDSTGYIDMVFTVTPTQGVTEYLFSEFVDNNSGINWSSYTMQLGFGTGAGFNQTGGAGDGLDFDTGPPGGNSLPPSSAVFPTVTRPNEDTLTFSGGIQSTDAQLYQFRIDVSDLAAATGPRTFTIRQQPIAIPEPSAIVFAALALAGFAVKRRYR